MDATRNHYVKWIGHTQKNNIFFFICKIQNFIWICIYTRGGPNTRTGITIMVEMLREGGNTDSKGI